MHPQGRSEAKDGKAVASDDWNAIQSGFMRFGIANIPRLLFGEPDRLHAD
ncbi:MAG: hypothetical protein GY792_10190 [Gammaproteobacteria bacterium]|nr:hypothetical protein [Gammaproteobacteria bacterium]